MKYLTICLLLLTSCASPGKVWLVKQTTDGGVLGYQKNGDSDDDLNKKMAALIQCPGSNETLSDELKSKDFTYVTQAEASRAGTVKARHSRAQVDYREVSSVPVSQTGTTSWRELTYKCN